VRGYKGKERRSTGDAEPPGVVSLVAKLRGHERPAAEELEQWNTGVEERKVIDASPAAITLAMLMTTAELEDLEKMSLELERSRRWSSPRSARGANENSPRRAIRGCTAG
jgi:hypothetical protein